MSMERDYTLNSIDYVFCKYGYQISAFGNTFWTTLLTESTIVQENFEICYASQRRI